MQDDNSPSNSSPGNSVSGGQPQGFFSPASSLALDYHQFVMEAKSIETSALSPIPSTLDFSPVERKDVRNAEEQLNSTSFDVAQTLARQLLGATSSVEINFSVPSFQKNQQGQNEEIVSELKNFGKSPEEKMSVSMQSPSMQTPTEKKTKGGSIFSGFLSKLKSKMQSKTKTAPQTIATPPISSLPTQQVQTPFSQPISKPLGQPSQFSETSQSIPQKVSSKDFTPLKQPPNFVSLQTDAKNLSAQKPPSGGVQGSVSSRGPPTIPNFKKAPPASEEYKEPVPVKAKYTPQTKPSQIPSPAPEPQPTSKIPPVQIRTPAPEPPTEEIPPTQNIIPNEAPKKKKAPAKEVQTPQNYDSSGFDSPLISPKRKAISFVKERDIFANSDDDDSDDDSSGGEETPKVAPPKKITPQVPPQAPPHYPGTDYHSSKFEPTRHLDTKYSLRSQIEQSITPPTKTPAQEQSPAVQIPPLPNSPPQKVLKKKITPKSITGKKSPPKIPLKKASPVQRKSTPIDELEGVAQDFSKLKRKEKPPVQTPLQNQQPQEGSPPIKYSSSLAKRLGIARRKEASSPKEVVPPNLAENIHDERLEDEDAPVEQIPDTSHAPKIFPEDMQDEPMPIQGEVKSKISNAAKDLLTPKKKIDVQKQQAEKQMADDLLFAYARENHKWLYEIYKMGGLSRDEFRSRVKEKMGEDKGSSQKKITSDGGENQKFGAENAAFSNISRSADKKFKK